MKKNVEGDQPFTLNNHMMTRLDQWDQSADQADDMLISVDLP